MTEINWSTIFPTVVLPLPDSPTTESTSPGAMVKLTSRTAVIRFEPSAPTR